MSTWSDEIQAGFGELLAAVGVPILWSDRSGVLRLNDDGTPRMALFKRPAELLFNGGQISEGYEIEFRAADFPGMEREDTMMIDGSRFMVRDIQQGPDPVLKSAPLKLLDAAC